MGTQKDWTVERTADGVRRIKRHVSGGHVTKVHMGEGRYMFDAWAPGMGGFSRNLGSYPEEEAAKAAVIDDWREHNASS